ncbi:hypothetical protein B9Z55_010486 [Caenorhabditis nigoni]|uniref:Tyr recombinase domain-containing protein n=1 Tax=Caenorhabditis nigoni TaxID=1611254 RepID=A0A2G5UFZ9_9PELO|nr:hypothetical protein B9Z55_010486 [Caenorhabditis nigoni]
MAEAIDKEALKKFGDEILGKVTELINGGVEKKKKEREVEEEKPPKVSSKGIQKNIDFNFKIRNVLNKAMAEDDLESGVKEVLELIKSRNGQLLLLDSDPNLLQTKEKLDALKAISGGDSEGSSTQADMTSILLLSNLTGMAGNKSGGNRGFDQRVFSAARETLGKMEAKFMEAEMAREASDATNVKDMGTTPMIVSKEEIKRLEEEGVVVRAEQEPRCVSPLHVVEQGDTGVAMSRWMMQVVGDNQRKTSESKMARKKKSPDIRSLERAESTSSSTSREQNEWDFLEGPKKDYIDELERQAGKEFQLHLDKLKAVPLESKASSTALAYKAENKKRKDWIIQKKLPLNESSFLLYLVDRAKGIGSSALSKISAAYQAANQGISAIGATFVSDVIKSKRREEVQCKKTVVEVTIQDVEKITKRAMDEITPARDRDALLAIFSFHVMLRASEAAEIRWEGVTQKDGMIEVHVEKAKNDQLRLGRSSFFNYKPGSDADILMCRWRIYSGGKCPYVFANLDGSGKLTKSSISALATKMLAAIGKPGATHHAFRRGGANHMRATGYSMEEIQARGRWRSLAGLQRYIKDVPRAQGCLHPQENGIGVEEDDEDFE